MKRRRDPDSSQTLARKPGYFESRLSSTSCTVAASTSTVSAPEVNFRSGVGMTTLSDMICTPEYFFERCELRFDHLRRRHIQRVECLQPISRDGENCQVRLLDAALLHQFLRNRDRHATRCLGEHAFGLGQQVNAANDLLVCTIFGPAAGLRDKARGEIAIGGVSNRERLCDGVRFHGTNIAAAALHGINNRIASCSLRSVEAGTLGFASQ